MENRDRPTPIKLAFHASRIVTDVGVLLVLGSMSLPFVTAAAGNRSAMALDALPVLILVAPIFAVTMIPDHTRPIPRPVAWAALVVGLAALPYAIVKYLDTAVLADTLDGGIGLGSRLLVFGAVVVVIGIGIGLTRSWMGLASGGTPSRRAAIANRRNAGTAGSPVPGAAATPRRPQPAPAGTDPRPAAPAPNRAAVEQSPFSDPLFDSLEVPAIQADDPSALRQPNFVFDIEGAADRVAPADDTAEEPDSES